MKEKRKTILWYNSKKELAQWTRQSKKIHSIFTLKVRAVNGNLIFKAIKKEYKKDPRPIKNQYKKWNRKKPSRPY